jgi:hypothetical protein
MVAVIATTVVMTAGTIGFGSSPASAHGDHTNPCGIAASGYNFFTGEHKLLPFVATGYDYSWYEGWLIAWDRGTPYRVYFPHWEGWC